MPVRARTCEVLLNAMLTFAARHKANTTSITESNSESLQYDDTATQCQRKCLLSLISMINDGQELADENGFAATIILRIVEEMEGKPTAPSRYVY